jgi:NAD(P)-dependent dehydrogenase (short-subunit alcohol dehydrogenase family)
MSFAPDVDLSRFDGRVVIIAGGTQGLGEATARLVAARGAAGLVLAGRSVGLGSALAAELTAAGCRSVFVEADVGSVDDCARIVATAVAEFGVVHGLVCVAASTVRGDVWTTPVEVWDAHMSINLRGPFLLLQAVGNAMVRAGVPGSVVFIGSVTGHGGQDFLTAYAVAKGGLSVLTKNAAYSMMRNRIRVNQLNLGWMDTPSEHAIQTGFHGKPDDWLVEAEAGQPMGRLVKPDEAARAICFMLSDESGLMTGTVVDFDQSVQGAGEAPKPPADLLYKPGS